MLSWFVVLALVAGALGQYKWDPTGQYRLVPDVEPTLRTSWTPKFFENRLVNSPIELVEPWRTVVMDTLPVVDVKEKEKKMEMLPKQYKTTEEQYKQVKPSEVQYGMWDILMRTKLPETMPKMEEMMLMEEERCMSMGECTVEIIERIKVKKPWMLDMLCENKGIGCLQRNSNGQSKQLAELLATEFNKWAGDVVCGMVPDSWCRRMMISDMKQREKIMQQLRQGW